jgi:glycosyltransferase involved in cell wall biosynthesis
VSGKFSFITVTFNNAEGLKKTIESYIDLIDLSRSNSLEIVVVDGASTDHTKDVLEKFSGYLDVVISESDKGIYDAMNKGVRAASGEFINFMNAGDCILPNGMHHFILACRDPSRVYFGNARWDCPNIPSSRGGSFYPWWLRMPNHQAMVFPRAFLLGFPFSSDFPINADLDSKINAYVNGFNYEYLDLDLALCEAYGISQLYKYFSDPFVRGFYEFRVANRHFGLFCGVVNFFKTMSFGCVKYIKFKFLN